MKTIQQVVIDDDKSIFITAYNDQTKKLTFRSSMDPKYMQTEKVTFDGELVYTNLYHFHIQFLQQFIQLNK